ncbi:MAG: PAS-domain containing protein [Pseudomonadota bacterium]
MATADDFGLVLFAIVLTFLSGALLGLGLGHRRASVPEDQSWSEPLLADGTVLLFRDGRLAAATEEAEQFLGGLGEADALWSRLSAALGPETAAAMDRLFRDGDVFRHTVELPDGRLADLRGAPRGSAVALIFRDVSEAVAARRAADAARTRVEAERDGLRDLVARAPFLIWRAEHGKVVEANRAYRALFGDPDGRSALPDLASADADTPGVTIAHGRRRDWGGPLRIAVSPRMAAEPHWFDLFTVEEPGGGGRTLGYGVDAAPVLKAETALKNFVATLTETFAHLPIGLAIFDRGRRLGLFNPALASLLGLDPAWMAGRPTLTEFLEALREARAMPDLADFPRWRRQIEALEGDGEEGHYEETWHLPSGRTLQVSGRPHPQGAIAFLFEDITTALALETRYRAAIEMREDTIDRLDEGVVVFDSSGAVVFANMAFAGIWGFEPLRELGAPGIHAMVSRWEEASEPSPVWAKLLRFATAEESRSAFSCRIRMQDGRILRGQFAPLRGGATLAAFADISEEERALARLQAHVAAAGGASQGRIAALPSVERGETGRSDAPGPRALDRPGRHLRRG